MNAKHLLSVIFTCCLLLAACAGPEQRQPDDRQAADEPTAAPSEGAVPTPYSTVTPLNEFQTGECLARGAFPPLLPGLSYGINVFLFGTDTDRALTLSQTAGFGWIRQQVHWRDVEGERGQYHWPTLDAAVRQARSKDLRVMLSIVRSPAWATAQADDGLPDDPDTLAAFLNAVATRYEGVVSAYEVWNEPNLAHENGGVPARAADYLPVLEAAYPAIKAADPCALVLSAPLASSNSPDPAVASSDLEFFAELYTLNHGAFLRAADIVALHPGGGPYAPDARWSPDDPVQSSFYFRHIERIREIMERHDDPRQVWLTELGWSVAPAEGAPPPVSQAEQADFLSRALWYTQQRYPWVSGVFVWNLNFSVLGDPQDEKSTFSLLNEDWSLRPSYLALQRDIYMLRNKNEPPELSPAAAYDFDWTFGGHGKMRTTPVLAPDGTVYVASDPGHLYALAPTGALRWRFDAPADTGNAPVRAPDGTLYLGSVGVLTAVAEDGMPLWEVRLRGRVRGSPIYYAEQIYTVARDGEVQAFDTQGREVWWYKLPTVATHLSLSPPDYEGGEAALLVGTVDGEVHKLSLDGERIWQIDLGEPLRPAPVAGPGGRIYVVTEQGRAIALDRQGQQQWSTDLHATIVAPALVDDELGRLYVPDRDGTLTALELSDGSIAWRYESGKDMVATPARGPDGTIYVGNDDERLLALTPDGGLRWEAEVSGLVRAQPTLAPDGRLFISTVGGRVYAFAPRMGEAGGTSPEQ
jgi:outer membrane protein assembly factor BamB